MSNTSLDSKLKSNIYLTKDKMLYALAPHKLYKTDIFDLYYVGILVKSNCLVVEKTESNQADDDCIIYCLYRKRIIEFDCKTFSCSDLIFVKK